MTQTIVGLSGFARSGKDEAAAVLVNEFEFTRVAFADKLREMLYQLDPLVGYEGEPFEAGLTPVGVQNVIDRYSWDGYKETEHGKEIRRLLQRLGTEAGRKTLWDTIWIDAAFAGVETDRVVVTDARFYNEFDAIRERGGTIWRVEREGVGPANEHTSEMEAIDYPHFDLTVQNDGSLEEYHEKIRKQAQILLYGRVL